MHSPTLQKTLFLELQDCYSIHNYNSNPPKTIIIHGLFFRSYWTTHAYQLSKTSARHSYHMFKTQKHELGSNNTWLSSDHWTYVQSIGFTYPKHKTCLEIFSKPINVNNLHSRRQSQNGKTPNTEQNENMRLTRDPLPELSFLPSLM
jgi:hypothetical protein